MNGSLRERWMRRPNAVTLVALIGLVAVACGGPGPSFAPTEDADPPVGATVERDGVRVTLWLEHGRIETGTSVAARLEVLNLGPGPVSWQSGGCGLLADLRIDGPNVVQPPEGRDWPGTAGLAKWSATTGGIWLAGFMDPKFARNDNLMICTLELRIEDIAAGRSARVDATWTARTTDGAPAAPGAYRAGVDFPFLGRFPAAQFSGDAFRDQRPISLDLDVGVVGPPFAGIPSTAAIDAALADPRVAAWIADVPRERLNGATIRLVDGVWAFEIKVQGGSRRVRVDATTGQVIDVDVAD